MRLKWNSFSLVEFFKKCLHYDTSIKLSLFSFLIKHMGTFSYEPLQSLSLKNVIHWLLLLGLIVGEILLGMGKAVAKLLMIPICVQIYILITPCGCAILYLHLLCSIRKGSSELINSLLCREAVIGYF